MNTKLVFLHNLFDQKLKRSMQKMHKNGIKNFGKLCLLIF